MSFSLETWKAQVNENLISWCMRLEQSMPSSLYSALCAVILMPLIQAIRGEGLLPIFKVFLKNCA